MRAAWRATHRALEILRNLRDQGDAEAAHQLALVYVEGKGGEPKDPVRGREFLERAAELGHAAAHNELCVIYDNGDGVAADLVRAFTHYKLAADAKITDAIFNLAMCYKAGRRVAVDLLKSCYS